MNNRQLGYQDIGKKCGFLLMASSPERNLHQIPAQIQTAFVINDGYLYYIDKEVQENRCIYIKMDSNRYQELKKRLNFHEGNLARDEVRIHAEQMSSDEFESVISLSMYFPTWLHKVLFFTKLTSNWQNDVWQYEKELRNLEQQIAMIEEICPVKFPKSDLEYLYPKNYKQVPSVWPTDYKIIKLKELNNRLALFDNSENKKVLSNQYAGKIKKLVTSFQSIQTNYLKCVENYQSLDKQLSDYCKEITLEEKNRIKFRNDIFKLPLERRMEAVSLMPGAISLSILMDIFLQLKKAYELELRRVYSLATRRTLDFNTFEDLFEQIYGTSAKEHFKEFAKNPTEKMISVDAEFEKLGKQFWAKKNVALQDVNKAKEFDDCFKTLLYLSSSSETFRFTDKVQRLDIATALLSFFGGDNIAIEFTTKLTATQVQNSFAVMPHSSALATPIASTYGMWLEAITWLHGFHQRAFSQVSPEFKEGSQVKPAILTHLGDDDDRQFFENKAPLVKWSIAQYHDQHCSSLLLLLPPEITAELVPLLPEEMLGQYKVKFESLKKEQKEQDVPQITMNTNAASSTNQPVVITNHQEPNKVLPSEVSVTNQSFLTQTMIQQTMVLGVGLPMDKLRAHKNDSPLVKFTKLKVLLQQYELNDEQNLLIESLKPTIVSMLENYNSVWFTFYYKPVIWGRTHSVEVTAALKNIKESESPKDYLLELIKLWEMVSASESKTIGPNTEAKLSDALVLLGINLEEKQEFKHVG